MSYNGIYTISFTQSTGDKKTLAATLGDKAVGVRLVSLGEPDSREQKWSIRPIVGTGYVFIQNAYTGLYLFPLNKTDFTYGSDLVAWSIKDDNKDKNKKIIQIKPDGSTTTFFWTQKSDKTVILGPESGATPWTITAVA